MYIFTQSLANFGMLVNVMTITSFFSTNATALLLRPSDTPSELTPMYGLSPTEYRVPLRLIRKELALVPLAPAMTYKCLGRLLWMTLTSNSLSNSPAAVIADSARPTIPCLVD